MSSELYIGLTTLEAAIVAIFAASIFVLIQTVTDLFTPVTPHFLVRRWVARGAIGLSVLILLFGLIASVMTAFPQSDVPLTNWHSDYLIENAWPAFVFALAVAVSVVLNLFVLVKLISDFRGPGVVTALEDRARHAGIRDWLDLIDPPEQNRKLEQRLQDLRRRHEQGDLTDPLEPLFEVAARSVEARRYSVAGRSLLAVRKLTAEWLADSKSPSKQDASRIFARLRAHFNDLLDVAVHAGSHSQIDALIRTYETMAVDALGRKDDFGYATRFADELVTWTKHLEDRVFRPLVVTIIESIERIGEAGMEKDDIEVFQQCLLKLGEIGEVMGSRYEPEVGIHILERNIGSHHAKGPDEALVYSVCSMIDLYGNKVDGFKGGVVFICDTLYICIRSYLSVRVIDERAVELAKRLFFSLGELALLAAHTRDGNALFTTVDNMRQLTEDPNFLKTKILDEALAHSAFETGMVAQANEGKMDFTTAPLQDDYFVTQLLALCCRCSIESLQSAVVDLYKRGITMDIDEIDPIARQTFLERLEAAVDHNFARF